PAAAPATVKAPSVKRFVGRGPTPLKGLAEPESQMFTAASRALENRQGSRGRLSFGTPRAVGNGWKPHFPRFLALRGSKMFSKSLIGMAAGVLALAAVWSAPAAATPVNGTLTLNANGNIQFTATGGATVPTFTGLSFAPSGNQFNAAGGSLDLAVFTGTSGTISDFTYLPSAPVASFVIISGSTALTFDLATVSVFTPPNGWTQTANAESGAFLLQ